MDFSQIMNMAGQLKNRLAEIQAEAANRRYTGEAGAGLVRVVMSGRFEVIEVKLEEKAIVPSERALLEDLIRAATNQAAAKVLEGQKEGLGDLARQMGVDPSMLGSGQLM